MVTRHGLRDVGAVGCDVMGEDKTNETRMAFAHIATLGLSLLGIYEFAPFFLGESEMTGLAKGAASVGTLLDRMPFVKMAAVVSVIPYIVIVTRRIPRRAILATRQGVTQDTDRQDVSRPAGSTGTG